MEFSLLSPTLQTGTGFQPLYCTAFMINYCRNLLEKLGVDLKTLSFVMLAAVMKENEFMYFQDNIFGNNLL